MAHLKEQFIEDAIEKIVALSEEGLGKLSETNSHAQPTLSGYLISTGLDFEDDTVMELVVFYFNIFMEAAAKQGLKLKTIDKEMISIFEEDYIQVLDEYQETEDEDAIKMICNQPVMLDFLMSEIHFEDEEGNTLEEETKSKLFIIGVALIGLLNRAITE